MTRYTKADTEKFIAEETARNEAETAAYYAWKRGDQPLGQPPPVYQPPDPDNTAAQINRAGHGVSELLDDAVREQGVGIDHVDVDDLSEEGRETKMKAMKDELEEFSVGQRHEAERMEGMREREGREKGREIRDQFGQKFEDVGTPRRPRR